MHHQLLCSWLGGSQDICLNHDVLSKGGRTLKCGSVACAIILGSGATPRLLVERPTGIDFRSLAQKGGFPLVCAQYTVHQKSWFVAQALASVRPMSKQMPPHGIHQP